MVEFYSWHRGAAFSITLMIALCVLSQTLAMVLRFYRYPRSRLWFFETLLELSILIHVAACSMLHGQTIHGHILSLAAPTEYAFIRIVVFIVIVLLSIVVISLARKPWPLSVIAVAGMTLPFMEQLTNNAFAYIYLFAILFWLVRSIPISLSCYREIRTNLSALSIKNAIDSLNTGVMFCEEDGFILLSNKRMQRLMTEITGKIQRDGRHFYGLITLGEINPQCMITWFEGQNVIVMPDGSAWMFTMAELLLKRKKYIQLTATDISERWKLTTQLQPQNEELMLRQRELSAAIAKLHILSRARETQRAKMRAHDILSERLTLLMRTVRSEQEPDYALLRFLSQGLIDELKALGNVPSPKDELDILTQVFKSIGVEILLDGEIPDDRVKGQLIAEIAREAVTNAVRHGFATQVCINIDDSNDGLHLMITNNGHPTSELIKEGGGISGMREKVKPFGGTLHVETHPSFALIVEI